MSKPGKDSFPGLLVALRLTSPFLDDIISITHEMIKEG
jgi:hypothetical protein